MEWTPTNSLIKMEKIPNLFALGKEVNLGSFSLTLTFKKKEWEGNLLDR